MKIRKIIFFLIFIFSAVGCTPALASTSTQPTKTVAVKATAATTPLAVATSTATIPTPPPPTEIIASLNTEAVEIVFPEEMEAIQSYRMEIIRKSFLPELEQSGGGLQMRGAVVKEPKAMMFTILGLSYVESYPYLYVGGQTYEWQGVWFESNNDGAQLFEELQVFSAAEVQSVMGNMEVVGVESIQGRMATHYHGDKEAALPLAEAMAYVPDGIEQLTLDVWVDQELGFVSKIEMKFDGYALEADSYHPEDFEEVTLSVEYYGINDTIAIVEPNDAGELPVATPLSPDTAPISSYRFLSSHVQSGPDRDALEGEPSVYTQTITGTVLTSPQAEQYEIARRANDEEPYLMEIRLLEPAGYVYSMDGGWNETTFENMVGAKSYLLGQTSVPTDADEIARALATMEQLGEENVAGRSALHYQGGIETFREITEIEDGQSIGSSTPLSGVEATVDIWIDAEFGYISKLEIQVEFPSEHSPNPWRIHSTMEYYDINEPNITIEAPEDAVKMD